MAILRNAALIGTAIGAALACSAPAIGHDEAAKNPANPQEQFEMISALAGEWQVKESASLRILFEPTAGGSVIVEKWMVGDRTHSLTLYHVDGQKLLATHYCPQGNQPRLVASSVKNGAIIFSFQDVTDLDPTESYQHDLSLHPKADGTFSRSETYWGPDGAGEESTLTLSRVQD